MRKSTVSKFQLKDLDVFYISFDEINCDANWARVLRLNPESKRVHGVLGFDKAHRACALASTTRRFVTIDGDNWLNDSTMEYELDDTNFPDVCFSFKSKNIINSLEYGNGGIKVWNKDTFLARQTHDQAGTTDFHWTIKYYQVDYLGSTTVNNCTPYQAWRAGYREGVKLSYINGQPANDFSTQWSTIWEGNLSMLNVWLTVGRDVENGIWAILGARQGLIDIISKVCKHTIINDYNLMARKWNEIKNCNVELIAKGYSLLLLNEYNFIVPELDATTSKWFKTVYLNFKRDGLM